MLEEHAISAGAFGLVERFVGRTDELFGRFRLQLGERCDTDADRDRYRSSFVFEHAAFDGRTQSFSEDAGVVEVHAATQNRELFTAVPCEHIFGADGLQSDLGDLYEHCVAGEVTEGVVHAFEVIDIEHDERQCGHVPLGVRELGFDAAEEVAFVERFGQAVSKRGVEHLLLEADVEVIVIGELEDRDRSEADLVAIFKDALRDAIAVHERAVRAVEILDEDLVTRAKDACMAT